MDPSTMYLTAFTIIGGIIFLVLFFHYVPFFLWLSAKVSGVNISLVQLFLMRIRNVPPYIIVPGLIEAHKAGLSNITRDELRKPTSNCLFKWPPPLTLPDAMCLRQSKCQ